MGYGLVGEKSWSQETYVQLRVCVLLCVCVCVCVFGEVGYTVIM